MEFDLVYTWRMIRAAARASMNKSTSWAQAVRKMTYNLHRRGPKDEDGRACGNLCLFWRTWSLIPFYLVLLQIEKRTGNSGRSIKPKQTGKKSPKYQKNCSDHQVCNFAPPVSGRPHLSLGTSFAGGASVRGKQELSVCGNGKIFYTWKMADLYTMWKVIFCHYVEKS